MRDAQTTLELEDVQLTTTAIGKDYLGLKPVGITPSGTGGQVSLFGLAGVTVGVEEGVEVNLLGLTLGVDPRSLSLKLPLIGRVGPDFDARVRRIEDIAAPDAAIAADHEDRS